MAAQGGDCRRVLQVVSGASQLPGVIVKERKTFVSPRGKQSAKEAGVVIMVGVEIDASRLPAGDGASTTLEIEDDVPVVFGETVEFPEAALAGGRQWGQSERRQAQERKSEGE